MKTFKIGTRVSPEKYWKGEGIVLDIYPSGDVRVKMLTGQQKGLIGAFDPENLTSALDKTKMSIVSIKRSTQKTGLKIYGKVLGESGKTYNFAYIRRPNFRGWICSCENFFFDMFKKSRNCKHLHFVRNEVGRFGTKVPKS